MAAWEFQMLQNIAEKNGWHKFISMQGYYNLIYREEENEMVRPHPFSHSSILQLTSLSQIPYCNATGVGLIPWSPIARGALTRPWGDRSSVRSTNDAFLDNLVHSREDAADKEIISRVEKIAKKHGVSMACIATAWTIKKGVQPIVGMSSKERIDEAVKNSNFKLSDEDAEYLEEAYLPKKRQGY